MPKRFSLAELLILTGGVALWIAWFQTPLVESGGCIADRPTKAMQRIGEYRIHGEEDYWHWFRRTISASPFASVPGYFYAVRDERSDLLVIPVSECPAKIQASSRLNGSLVFIRHNYVKASTTAQLLIVPSNASVVRGALTFPLIADGLIVGLPIMFIVVLRRNNPPRVASKEYG